LGTESRAGPANEAITPVAPADAALTLDGVVSGYGKMTVLNGTTFAVRRGAITTVIGPNGAGKSTVFKAVFGLLPVSAGRITFEGADITHLGPRELLSRGVCYVPQGRNIFPELSVRHNLELGGVSTHSGAELAPRVEAIMDRFPMLRQKAGAQASTLSGGQQKLLEIARSLLLEPKLLLIDEPSIGLSPLLVRETFDILRALRDRGVTILMVEQNAKSALEISEDGIVLELGRTRMQAPAADLLADPRVGRLFLGGAMTDAAA
jgi:branched-chain amino acid transport system ATP-binding protein